VTERHRWPRWVYGSGTEPDYRFSFANERTFLAWLRTSLALLAGGVAVDAFDLSLSSTLQRSLSALLTLLAMVCAIASWLRWARAERALRHQQPLPATHLSVVLAVGLAAVAVALLVAKL
jgi:putative membrane protein